LAPKLSVADSILILRQRYPGALVCTNCARMIASTRTGYAPSNLTPDEVDNYVCSGCRFDADPARSAEFTARFAASKAIAAAARLCPPFIAIVPGTSPPGTPGIASKIIRLDDACACTDMTTCDPCLLSHAAEAAYGRRVALDYLGTCAMSGRHRDAEALADCPNPSPTVTSSEAPSFCTHSRPIENCIVHASPRRQPAMPAKLARCESCLGYHGKTGRDRCPYSQREAAAVKASRAAATTTARTREMPTGSKTSRVADSVPIQPNSLERLHRTNSHLANASKRLRRKPGRAATGTSRWAGLRRKQRGEALARRSSAAERASRYMSV
jgi:hypothetical protein